MIKIKISDIAKKNGLENAYALQKALDCSPTMASRLWKASFKQIGIETLDKLCELLKCEPSDLLVFGSKVEKVRQAQEKPAREPGTLETGAPGEYTLTVKDAAEFIGRSERQVRTYAKGGLLKGVQGKQSHWFFQQADLQTFVDERK